MAGVLGNLFEPQKMAVKDRILRSCKQPEKFFGGKVTHMSCRYSAFPNPMTIISIGIIRVNFQYWYLAAPWKKSGPLPGPRPALWACPAGPSPPGCASLCPNGKSRIAAKAGRAWLWRSFRNP